MKKKDQVTAAEEQKEAARGKGKKRRVREAQREIRWDRLDNTAHLFPVIAGESMSNVYRISVTLTELVNRDLLQQALDMVLPKFDGFNLRLRQGVFWYYFEENGKPAPRVREESAFPCRYIRQNKNHSYMFRVTYYKYRINLEVFHVLTDGMGGINFLKELTYQYLRLAHPKLREKVGDSLSSDTSLNREDSFLKNYKHSSQKGYQTKRAYLLKGEKLPPGEFGVMHGYMKIPELKKVCHAYGVSINEYLVAVYTFEEVLKIVSESLRSQINRENLEKLFSYNVSNEKLLAARIVPLFLKNLAMRYVYTTSALANTATVTNIGNISVGEEYRPYVEMFHAFLAMSKGQHLKGTICSYGDTLVFSFSYDLTDTSVQRGFFRKIAADGIAVEIETNGVNYE